MNQSASGSKQQAIVLGGSIAGLMAARVLSRHYGKVIILEKDTVHRVPQSRKSQPQTRHLHCLLPSGYKVMCSYFPGFPEEIVRRGAEVFDFGASLSWITHGGFKKRHVLGTDGVSISRPLLEHMVRERVLLLPNVQMMDNINVQQFTVSADNKTITGVVVEDQACGQISALYADLVVDCTGRGSRTPRWLRNLGYKQTPVTEVKVDVGYTTRIYKRAPGDPRSKTWIAYSPKPPLEKRFGAVLAMEDDRWIVTVGGWHGDHASTEENEYMEFVKSLPHPDMYDIVHTCEPLSGFMQHKFPVSLRRHYEKQARFPAGLLVLGDAISSFNPVYGQGMSSACLQAETLDNLLQQNIAENKLAKAFFKRTSQIIDHIWQIATGEDLRFRETIGARPVASRLVNKYLSWIHQAAITDEVVSKALVKVISLLAPPSTLFHPAIVWRVLRAK